MTRTLVVGRTDRTAITEMIERQVNPLEPGVAVAVLHGEQVLVDHCAGLSSLESRSAIDVRTRFAIASLTKPIFAFAMLQRAEVAGMDLDDPVGHHLPGLPPGPAAVTLRQLLAMSSGLREELDLVYLASGRTVPGNLTRAGLLELVLAQRTRSFGPDEHYLYCNSNYSLLQSALQARTGVPLEEFLDDSTFRPLGMTASLLATDPVAALGCYAVPYERGPTGYRRGLWLREGSAAGGGVSSIEDLVRWHLELRRQVLAGTPAARAMTTPHKFSNGRASHYGCGIVSACYRGRPYLGHAGGLPGVSADYLWFTQEDIAVIVLANRDDFKAMRLSRRIADHVIEGVSVLDRAADPGAVELAGEMAPQWTGTWVDPAARRVVNIGAAAGMLTANNFLLDATSQDMACVLIGDEPTVYRYERRDAPTLCESFQSGRRARLDRCEIEPVAGTAATSIEGHYVNPDLPGSLEVYQERGQARARFGPGWPPGEVLQVWRAATDIYVLGRLGEPPVYGWVLAAERTGEGRVTGLTGQFDRTLNYRWTRRGDWK